MFSLLLAILSSAMIAILMRLTKNRVRHEMVMFLGNYAVCSLLSAVYGFSSGQPASFAGAGLAVALGAVGGCLFLASFMLMQTNIRRNGVVLSATFMKLGVLVPTAMAVAVYHEQPTVTAVLGFLLAVAAILIINLRPGESSASVRAEGKGLLLVLLLLFGGLADAMPNIFDKSGTPAMKDLFLLCIFFTAGVLSLILALRKGQRLNRRDLLWGAVIGVPNYYSSRFLLQALGGLPAVVVYPVFNIAVLLTVTVAGVLFFRERPGKRQTVGLIMILGALVLLNL